MSVTIPVRAFAIAAFNAASLLSEDPCDVFDPDAKSRARFVAIEAMRVMFPTVDAVQIANNLGFVGRRKLLTNRLICVKCAKWWNDKFVERVVCDLEIALKAKRGGKTYFERAPEEPTVSISKATPDTDATRHVSIPRATLVRRPANMTGYLLGDPGCGSRRVNSDERSLGI